MPRRSPKEIAQAAVHAWNAEHPIGTPVRVRMTSGGIHRTTTRSAAQVLAGHSAVIWLEGIVGCYLLSRVTATSAQEKPYAAV